MSKPKIIQQGAEAKIFLTKSNALTHPNNKKDKSQQIVIKARTPKHYRIPELDNQIRKRRTKSEAKILEKAGKIINIPSLIKFIDYKPNSTGNPAEYSIKMEYIEGKKLSEHLDKFELKKQKNIMKIIGESIAKLHKNEIIHGDLTTSNMILKEEKMISPKQKLKGRALRETVGVVYFIDFGLGFISRKNEDKAVDLHLLKQALEAKHFKNWITLFKEVSKSYEKTLGKEESKKVFERITTVERRGRYRH
jgi:TP53 regulating kinase-like protein